MIYAAPKRMTPLVAVTLQNSMLDLPKTYDELVSVCGLSKPAVARWVKQMHHAGFAYVAAWDVDKNGRVFVARWGWGCEKDTPRPGPSRTPAERMKALRLSRKESRK